MKRTRSIFLLFVLIYLAIVSAEMGSFIYDERDLFKDGTTALYNFWNFQFIGGSDNGLFSDISSLVVIPLVGSFVFIYLKNNHAFYNVQQRIGYRGYLRLALRRTMIGAAVFSVLIKIYQLLFVILLTRTMPSNDRVPEEMMFGQTAFNDNTLMSVAIYTVLSAVGWAIFAAFIFSIGLFIKKNSVYFVLGPVIGLSLLLVPIMVTPKDKLIDTVIYLFYFSNLMSPGQIIFNVFNGNPPNVYLAFVLACLFYGGIASILIRVWTKRQRMEG